MWLHRNLTGCLLLFLLISCLKTANGDGVREVNITGRWQMIFSEINNTTSTITHERKITYGWRTNERAENIITIKHDASGKFQLGGFLQILSLSVAYSFEHTSERRILIEKEVHRLEELTITYTIQPWTRITRWQFIADVLGNEYRFHDTLSLMDNQIPKSYSVSARVQDVRMTPAPATSFFRRQIHYGITPIRIKHKRLNKYITVVTRYKWPAATLGYRNSFHFILFDRPQFGAKRIKTLNTMNPGYEWLYSSINGGIYFDLDRDYYSGQWYHNGKQYWHISKSGNLYDGDVVTFTNKYYDDSYMCYHEGRSTDVYCFELMEDEWILEVV